MRFTRFTALIPGFRAARVNLVNLVNLLRRISRGATRCASRVSMRLAVAARCPHAKFPATFPAGAMLFPAATDLQVSRPHSAGRIPLRHEPTPSVNSKPARAA